MRKKSSCSHLNLKLSISWHFFISSIYLSYELGLIAWSFICRNYSSYSVFVGSLVEIKSSNLHRNYYMSLINIVCALQKHLSFDFPKSMTFNQSNILSHVLLSCYLHDGILHFWLRGVYVYIICLMLKSLKICVRFTFTFLIFVKNVDHCVRTYLHEIRAVIWVKIREKIALPLMFFNEKSNQRFVKFDWKLKKKTILRFRFSLEHFRSIRKFIMISLAISTNQPPKSRENHYAAVIMFHLLQ